MSATETTMIAVSAVAGVEVMTRKLWGMATALGRTKMFVITKMDHDRARFQEVVEQLREIFGTAVVPVFLPLGEGKNFKGVINLLGDVHNAPPELQEQATAMH